MVWVAIIFCGPKKTVNNKCTHASAYASARVLYELFFINARKKGVFILRSLVVGTIIPIETVANETTFEI